MFKNLKISTKLTLTSCGLAVLILLLVVGIVAFKSLKMANENTSAYIKSEVEKNAKSIAIFLSDGLQASRVLSEMISGTLESGHKLSPESLLDIFLGVAKNNPNFASVWFMPDDKKYYSKEIDGVYGKFVSKTNDFIIPIVSNTTGTPVQDQSEGDHLEKEFYNASKNSKKAEILDPYVDVLEGKNVLMTSFTSPVIVNDKVVGVVGIDMNVAKLQETVGAIKLYDTDYSFLFSHTGKFVAHNKAELIGKKATDINPGLKVFIDRLSTNEPLEIETLSVLTNRASKMVYAGVSVPEFDKNWGIVLVADIDETLTDVNELKNFMIIFSLISVIVLFLAMWAYSRTFGKRIERVASNLEHFFEFLNFKTDKAELITIKANDEIGKMGMLINDNIKTTQQNLVEQNEFIAQASG
ncbi:MULTISPECIES: PDC sensor domain-containing protein, partial [unclassified Campylobacter]|uniref:PDC sensor domain-containing protein n=1 Tax=unclassified Campylobacter TaxID=2593542 RepID=UPI003D33730A